MYPLWCIIRTMLIKEWRKHETLDIWLRTTYSFPGDVIYFGGQRSGHPYISSRRYSVVDARSGIKLGILATSYKSGFDSWDEYQVHKKYVAGETTMLLERSFAGTIEEALAWTGITQELESL